MARLDDPYKEGYLCFPPQGSKEILQKYYCTLFKWSEHGIDRLEVIDGIDSQKSSDIASTIKLHKMLKNINLMCLRNPEVAAHYSWKSAESLMRLSRKRLLPNVPKTFKDLAIPILG